MSKRYFYDCPIKAAYMVRYHGMKIHGPVQKPTGGIDTSTRPMPVWVLARAIEAAEKGMSPEDARYYVADESLRLLKATPGDLLTGSNRRVFMFYNNTTSPTDRARVAERNGIPFIWPESEAA